MFLPSRVRSLEARRLLSRARLRQPQRRTRLAVELLEDRLAPAILTVNSTADTANATDPYLSLREAIDIVDSATLPTGLSSQIMGQISGTLHANGSDTIMFDQTSVTAPIVLGGTQLELDLPSGTATITIDGGAGITVNGNNASRVFQVDSGVQATLANLTITGGNASNDSGGGIYNNGTLTLTNSTLSGNTASADGGGMYNSSGTVTLTNDTLSGNSATEGGGMYNYASSSLTLTNVIFSNNSASNVCGGMFNSSSSPTLTNVIFSNNSGAYAGGGMYNYASSSPTLTNCTFSNNSADYGGGMENYGSSSPTLTNCILWGDKAFGPAIAEIDNESSGSVTVSYSDVQGGWAGTGNINADPLFVDPAHGDLHLQAGSPAIDAGTNTFSLPGTTNNLVPSFDLDNNPRPVDGDGDGDATTDMGAYEFLPAPAVLGLTDWYRAEGNADDGGVGDNPGTLVGPVSFAPGKVGQAFSFNGSSYVSVPDAPSLSFTSAVSLDAWVNPATLNFAGGFGTVVAKSNYLAARNYGLWVTSDGSVQLSYFNSSGANVYIQNTVPGLVSPGVWTNVAGVIDTVHGVMQVYVNGQLVASQATSGPMVADNVPLTIGADDGGTYFFNGLIDEVQVYNRALAPADVLKLAGTIVAGGAVVSGEVYDDVNGSGSFTTGDPGLSGWKVDLTNTSTNSTYTTTTDASGLFSLTGIAAGTYTLSEVVQPGFVQTQPASPGTYTITVASGQTVTGEDFGDHPTASISGVVFNDLNGDGTLENGEPGLSGWTVNLLNSSDQVLATATTGSGGNYSFTSLLPGTYTVQVVSQSGYDASSAASVTITDDNGQADTVNFGEFVPVTISGEVYSDTSGSGLSGWTVDLVKGSQTVQTTTGSDGSFSFTNVGPGTYTVEVVSGVKRGERVVANSLALLAPDSIPEEQAEAPSVAKVSMQP